jgi:hypothetical protein
MKLIGEAEENHKIPVRIAGIPTESQPDLLKTNQEHYQQWILKRCGIIIIYQNLSEKSNFEKMDFHLSNMT